MYYLVKCIVTTQLIYHQKIWGKVLQSAVYPVQWMRLMLICCGMAVMRVGILGVSARKVRTLTVKMETVTLIGTGR